MALLGIRTSSLRPDEALGFDVYLLISGKHLLYVKRSDVIAGERLDRLQLKNVRQLFITDEDKPLYEEFLRGGAQAALSASDVPLAGRARVIAGQSKAAVEEMFVHPQLRENYERARSAAANQVAFLLKQPEALEPILAMAKFDRTVYQHSVNVASIAVGLAAGLGAPLDTISALGLGGLLHDLGKSPAATSTGVADWRQHPRAGAGLLLNRDYVSRDVLDLILLHEERLDGRGYPAGAKKLDQIFQVMGLANFYDRLVTIEGRDPRAAYDEIEGMNPLPYERDLIHGLKDVLVANKIC
ncbi:MAG: HD domain-containing protein [Deltaproteobacteria bacterium]|nr:HD domain-containing protein [Deltaproteobacteria bacterium]